MRMRMITWMRIKIKIKIKIMRRRRKRRKVLVPKIPLTSYARYYVRYSDNQL